MFKLFFESLHLGVKSFYSENRNLILFLITSFLPATLLGGIKVCINRFWGFDNVIIWLLIFILAYIVAFIILANYIHTIDAQEYAQKHSISFEEAWNATKSDDGDDWF